MPPISIYSTSSGLGGTGCLVVPSGAPAQHRSVCAGTALAPLEEHMIATTPHIPTCIALEDVANPQDLWDLVIEGESFPEDEPSLEA